MPTLQRFDIKDPGEDVVLTYDFTKGLAAGETLIGVPTIAVRTVYGVDPSPTAILNGSASFDAANQMVFVPVLGGLDGVDYDIVVTALTSNPKKIWVLGCILPVRVQ